MLTTQCFRIIIEKMATIKYIAKITGCSVMTVSRALNNPELVKEETRKKILAALESLGYVQNRVARALVKGCTFNICVYIPASLEATETFVAQTVSSIGEQLGKRGYSLSLCRNVAFEHHFDGVIAVGLHIEDEDEFIALSKEKPAVLYGNSEKFTNWVDVDNYRGLYKITELVLGKGHKKIAYIGMNHHARHVVQRKQGFLDALAAHSVTPSEDMIISTTNSEQAGFDACERLLERSGPTAIVCSTDLIAVGCMHALQRRGISVPDGIAVTGFDGFGYENTVFPKLTTVKQPLYEAGVRLADAVINIINGKRQQDGIYIEPEIKNGESV